MVFTTAQQASSWESRTTQTRLAEVALKDGKRFYNVDALDHFDIVQVNAHG